MIKIVETKKNQTIITKKKNKQTKPNVKGRKTYRLLKIPYDLNSFNAITYRPKTTEGNLSQRETRLSVN